MGMRNWFRKSSKIFDKEGFYIVLFVCLCVVAIAAVIVSRQNANLAGRASKTGSESHYTEPENNKEVVVNPDIDDNNAAPVINTPVKPDDSNKDDSSKSPSSNSDSSSETSNKILGMPVQGDITKGFSKEELAESLTMGHWETHEGIDIACDIGTEIVAAADGKVVDVITEDKSVDTILKTGHGVSVIIEHSNGVKTVYSNLADTVTDENGNVVSAIKVKTGDTVKAGDVIGEAGDTSQREMVSIEGSHLHFEVWKLINNEYQTVNPEEYFK